MEELPLISRSLYRAVGEELGTEKIVDMRRRVMALQQSFDTTWMRFDNAYEDKLLSGSLCEGFRFASSDEDWMFVCRNIRVVFSSATEYQCSSEKTILLAEHSATKPGFVLLRLLNHSADPRVTCACVPRGDGYYVASQKWRDNAAAILPCLTPHGPCGTTVRGSSELDFAICIKSDKLPKEAYGFARRLHRAGWPTASELQTILSTGCHFVAIGAKESPTELIEWRISFSVIEKLLIHTMNHVQFLCFGLLKIFLKEAIDVNEDIKGLLCSYFLKTALFWEIVTNGLEWHASNFLSCFWICFQRLLYWINNEYCPNFFIPENNMFSGKVRGAARIRLLSYLVPLYQEGYSCLLRCPSIQNELFNIIQQPLLWNSIYINRESKKCEIEIQLITEAWFRQPSFFTVGSEITKQMQCLEHINSTSGAQLEQTVLHLWQNCLIQSFYIMSCFRDSVSLDEASNKSKQFSMTAMPAVDATRHLLYTALHHYQSGMYIDAISLLREAKLRLQHPHLIYTWAIDVEKYRAAGGEHKPFTQMMKEIVAFILELVTAVTIPELILEHGAALSHSVDSIPVPPLVFTIFLCFCCYHKMLMVSESTSMLQELSILVEYDDMFHICIRDKAIAWQILGICQEMSDDRKGAYRSYCNALQQKLSHIRQASLIRIRNITRL